MWFGWAFRQGRWHKLTGPHEDMGKASRELSRVLRARGWFVRARFQVLTFGPQQPRDLETDHPHEGDGIA